MRGSTAWRSAPSQTPDLPHMTTRQATVTALQMGRPVPLFRLCRVGYLSVMPDSGDNCQDRTANILRRIDRALTESAVPVSWQFAALSREHRRLAPPDLDGLSVLLASSPAMRDAAGAILRLVAAAIRLRSDVQVSAPTATVSITFPPDDAVTASRGVASPARRLGGIGAVTSPSPALSRQLIEGAQANLGVLLTPLAAEAETLLGADGVSPGAELTASSSRLAAGGFFESQTVLSTSEPRQFSEAVLRKLEHGDRLGGQAVRVAGQFVGRLQRRAAERVEQRER
jgi:hypothetical protein